MKRGFTLIELSIVLIIIGFLIGGILAARSLVSTAKIQASVRQMQQYNVVISSFISQYKELPGDSTSMPNPGNGDRKIDYWAPDEEGNFDYHLSLGTEWKNSKGQDYAYRNYYSDNVTRENCVSLKIDSNPQGIPCLYAKNAVLSTVNASYPNTTSNYLQYDAFNGPVGNSATIRDMIRPADALSLDQKFDDGLPYSGKMMSSCGNASSKYDLNTTTYACEMIFTFGKIDVNLL